MSSSRKNAALVFVLLTSFGIVTSGCGRSPAMPRTPVKLVRVENGQAVPCSCALDDDDDDASPLARKTPVQYVHISEWQPPASAERAAAEVAPRGEQPPSYIEFPSLTLHKPIAETTYRSGRYRWKAR